MNKETASPRGTVTLDDSHGEPSKESKAVLGAISDVLGYEPKIGPVKACDTCGFFDCVCGIRKDHEEGCKFRRATTCAIPIECDHGFDVCPKCDPCTCKSKSEAKR